jgi:hypothetical protein
MTKRHRGFAAAPNSLAGGEAEPRRQLSNFHRHGKAEPFRKSGGKAALRFRRHPVSFASYRIAPKE